MAFITTPTNKIINLNNNFHHNNNLITAKDFNNNNSTCRLIKVKFLNTLINNIQIIILLIIQIKTQLQKAIHHFLLNKSILY